MSSVSYVSTVLVVVMGLVVGIQAQSMSCGTSTLGCLGPQCVSLATGVCAERLPCPYYNESTSCIAAGCSFNTNKKCVDANCASMTSERECNSAFALSGSSTANVCKWNATLNLCLHAYCASALPQLCAVQNSFCTVSRGTCVDLPLTNLPCRNASSPAMCVMQLPEGRCAVNTDKICAEQQLPACSTLKPTSSVPCPSRCVSTGSICVDPTCPFVTSVDMCRQRGCNWLTTFPNCVDPNMAHVACSAFTQATCPLTRCQPTFSGCSDLQPTPNNTTTTSCKSLTLQQCKIANPALQCIFNQTANACQDRPCLGLNATLCPLTRCEFVSDACVDLCPQSMVVCPTRTCAKSESSCTTCRAPEVQCWDSTCVASMEKCPCPPYTPVRCPNSSHCVPKNYVCPTTPAPTTATPAPTTTKTPAPTTPPAPTTTLPAPTTTKTPAPTTATPAPGKCVAPQVVCPDGRCVLNDKLCEVTVAPPTTPAPGKCDSTKVVCPDGRCADTMAGCPCKETGMERCQTQPYECMKNCSATRCTDPTPYQCPDGRCVLNDKLCEVTKPTASPTTTSAPSCVAPQVVCPDGSCAREIAQCPCPARTPVKCPNGKCVTALDACIDVCPTATPYKCWNNLCAVSNVSCLCARGTERCPTDELCYASLAQCPCKVKGTVRCQVSPFACSTNCSAKCADRTPFQCPDGSCAANEKVCPCTGAGAKPSITLNIAATTFSASSWLRVPATVQYTVCGRDLSANVEVLWSISFTNGSSYNGRGVAGAVLKGQTMAAPPHYFVVGNSYVLSAVATVSGTTVASSASVTGSPVYSDPIYQFIGGGAKRVSLGVNTSIAVVIRDPNPYTTMKGSWSCCTSKVCGLSCNATVIKSTASGQEMWIAPTTTGYFTVRFHYGANSESTANPFIDYFLEVAGYPVLNVEVISGQEKPMVSKALVFYAAVNNSDRDVGISWLLNSEPLTTSLVPGVTLKGRGVQFARYTLSAGTIYNLTAVVSSNGRGGAASTTFSMPAIPTFTCSVKATDDSTTAVTLQTPLRIEVTGTALDLMAFRFFFADYADRSQKAWRNVSLSQAWQNMAYLDTVAPATVAVAAANASRVVNFYVFAKFDGQDDVAWTTCSLELHPSLQTTAKLVENVKANLEAAKANRDVGAVIREVTSISGTADANTTRRSDTLSSAVGALQTVAGTGDALSTEQRSAVVQSLRTLTTNVAVSETQKASILNVLTTAMKSDTTSSVSTSDTKFNPIRDGKAALDTLSMLKVDSEVAKTVETLSTQLANSAPLGVATALVSTNMTLSSVRVPATDIGGSVLKGTNSSITMPANFSVPGASMGTEVAVTSTEFATSPHPANDKQQHVGSAVVDFTVLSSGVALSVKNTTDPLILNLSMTRPPRKNETVVCQFFDPVTKKWSTVGVTTLAKDNVTNSVRCGTTHLSAFALIMMASAPGPNDDNGGSSGGASGNDALSSGAIAGIAFAAVLFVLIFVIACVYVKCCKKEDSYIKDGPKNLRHPSNTLEEGEEMKYDLNSLVEL